MLSVNIQGSLDCLQFFSFNVHKRDRILLIPSCVWDRGFGERDNYLGSVACNITSINILVSHFRGAFMGHLPALRCTKMTSDHLDLCRIWCLGIISIHSFASVPNRNIFSLSKKRGSRSRSIHYFCKNISLISIMYMNRNVNVVLWVKQMNFCLKH